METSDENNKMDNFKKIIIDFKNDLLLTFPELIEEINNIQVEKDINILFDYCKSIYPERFFDIIYQNNELFDRDDFNSFLLPGIDFKILWKCEITDKTREIMWKYLQLILFSVVGDMSDHTSFGDTSKLFEAINENDLKKKLEETMAQMKDMFPESNGKDMPDPNEIHEHLSNMMEGKIGTMAKEIMEEMVDELDINTENITSTDDVFKKIFANPNNLLMIIKKIGTKIDQKIKDGDIKQSELMEEASEMLKNMKNMKGMGNIESMLNQMGLNKGKSKVNMNALKSELDKQKKMAKMKESMKQRAEQKKNNNVKTKEELELTEDQKEILRMLDGKASSEEIENFIFGSDNKNAGKSKKKKNKKKVV